MGTPDIAVKRIYEPVSGDDGVRILVDRLWPRGMSKERAAVDLWMKGVSPSNELRRWYQHDPDKWPEFRQRYRKELSESEEAFNELLELARLDKVTLLFSSKETRYNNAEALRLFILDILD